MIIALWDIDSKLVNLALMKISEYHRNRLDTIKWFMPLDNNYDKLYVSKIFNFTKIPKYNYNNIEIGGTGFDVKKKLRYSINTCQPDYSIYHNCDYSLQYFSRGCIRKCKFCVVPEKEGYIYPVDPMNLNSKGKYIRILDNNFFANPLYKEAINYLIKTNQPVSFDSGLDIRIFNNEQGNLLKKIKIYKMLYIAWDNPKQDLTNKIKLLTKYIKPYKITVYVLIGFDSLFEEDYLRVMKINELGCNPFVIPYNKNNNYQKKFARWVNRKAIFKSVKWEDYK